MLCGLPFIASAFVFSFMVNRPCRFGAFAFWGNCNAINEVEVVKKRIPFVNYFCILQLLKDFVVLVLCVYLLFSVLFIEMCIISFVMIDVLFLGINEILV